MLKLIGGILIVGACGALGLSARQALRVRISAVDGLLRTLEQIENEIAFHHTPLPELIEALAAQGDARVAPIFLRLKEELRQENGLSLSYKWCRAARAAGPDCGLRAEEIGVWCDAAAFLGKYDSERQCSALRATAGRLAAVRDTVAEELKNKGNLYRTCGLTLGILTVIVLL